MKLDQLTKEQESLMPAIVKKWTDKALRNTDGVDLDALREGAAFVYELAKLPPPKVLVVASPLGVQYATHLIKQLGNATNVRANVWDNVGANVEANVWANVRDNVWANVRDNVGANVRANVGANVSDNVWDNVEANVWANVGANVGANVEANVWANVRDNVWANVGDNVGANVRANVRDNVGANVWDNVGANVGDNVRDNVRANVWANVEANVWANVWDNVWDNVRANVEANVSDNVWANVGDTVAKSSIKFETFAHSSIMWSGWVAFYEFFTQIGVLSDDKFNKYVEYLNAGGTFTVMMDKILVTCPCPTKIYVDDQQRLHSDQFAAIQWADGYAQWYLDGVSLTHEIWSKIVTHEMTFGEIMAIEDADVRAVALKYNQNAIIADGAELIDEHPTAGELFLIRKRPINKLVNKPNIYFLRMKCQSTGRVFVEAVDPDYAKQNPYALHCQAKAFGVSPEIYGQLQQRNMG